jgi:hypothetical protein
MEYKINIYNYKQYQKHYLRHVNTNIIKKLQSSTHITVLWYLYIKHWVSFLVIFNKVQHTLLCCDVCTTNTVSFFSRYF